MRSLLDRYDLRCDYARMYGVNGRKWLKNLKLPSDNDDATLHRHSGIMGRSVPLHTPAGDSLYLGKMKNGNKRIRWILTEAANIAARTDDRFKQFYANKAKRHGHNIAISHLANKMLVIIWHMLTEERLYRQRKETLYNKKT